MKKYIILMFKFIFKAIAYFCLSPLFFIAWLDSIDPETKRQKKEWDKEMSYELRKLKK